MLGGISLNVEQIAAAFSSSVEIVKRHQNGRYLASGSPPDIVFRALDRLPVFLLPPARFSAEIALAIPSSAARDMFIPSALASSINLESMEVLTDFRRPFGVD
nr:hypothetical protein [Mesorhizobium sp.]